MRSAAFLSLFLFAFSAYGAFPRWARVCPSLIAERFWIGSFASRLQAAADPTKHLPAEKSGERPAFQFTWQRIYDRTYLVENWSGIQFSIESGKLRVALRGPKNVVEPLDEGRVSFDPAGLIATSENRSLLKFEAPSVTGDLEEDARRGYAYWANFMTEFVEKELLYRRFQLPLVSSFTIERGNSRGNSSGFSWWPIEKHAFDELDHGIQLEGVLLNRPAYSAAMPPPYTPWLVGQAFFRAWGIELRAFQPTLARVHFVPYSEYVFGDANSGGLLHWVKAKGPALHSEGVEFQGAPGVNAVTISRAREVGRDPANRFEPLQFAGHRVKFLGDIRELKGREGTAVSTVDTRYVAESGGVRSEVLVDFGADLRLKLQGHLLEILGPAQPDLTND